MKLSTGLALGGLTLATMAGCSETGSISTEQTDSGQDTFTILGETHTAESLEAMPVNDLIALRENILAQFDSDCSEHGFDFGGKEIYSNLTNLINETIEKTSPLVDVNIPYGLQCYSRGARHSGLEIKVPEDDFRFRVEAVVTDPKSGDKSIPIDGINYPLSPKLYTELEEAFAGSCYSGQTNVQAGLTAARNEVYPHLKDRLGDFPDLNRETPPPWNCTPARKSTHLAPSYWASKEMPRVLGSPLGEHRNGLRHIDKLSENGVTHFEPLIDTDQAMALYDETIQEITENCRRATERVFADAIIVHPIILDENWNLTPASRRGLSTIKRYIRNNLEEKPGNNKQLLKKLLALKDANYHLEDKPDSDHIVGCDTGRQVDRLYSDKLQEDRRKAFQQRN